MSTAKKGDKVRIHYTGRLDDGTVFDSSADRDPLEFQLGAGQVIAGFDNAIEGMKIGETKTEKIPVDDAYGPRRDDLVMEVPKEQLPSGLEPEVGQVLELRRGEQIAQATIAKVAEATILLDVNHPLAGKDLEFDIELVEIVA